MTPAQRKPSTTDMTEQPHHHHSALPAIGLVCFAYACFSLFDALTKTALKDLDIHVLLFSANLLSCIVATVWIASSAGLRGFKTRKLKFHLIRAAVNAASTFFAATALSQIPMSDFYAIIFLAPFLLAIQARLFLKETLNPLGVIALLTGFSGIVLIYGLGFAASGPGVLAAFGCTVCIGMGNFLLRIIGPREHKGIYVLFPSLGIMLSNLPFLWGMDLSAISVDAMTLVPAISALQFIGLIAIGLGFGHAPKLLVVLPFAYSQAIWGVLYDVTLFGTTPAPATLGGLLLVSAAGIILILREKLLKRAYGRTHAVQSAPSAPATCSTADARNPHDNGLPPA